MTPDRMYRGPFDLPASELEACFSAASRRVIIAAFRAQIAEADIMGLGTCQAQGCTPLRLWQIHYDY